MRRSAEDEAWFDNHTNHGRLDDAVLAVRRGATTRRPRSEQQRRRPRQPQEQRNAVTKRPNRILYDDTGEPLFLSGKEEEQPQRRSLHHPRPTAAAAAAAAAATKSTRTTTTRPTASERYVRPPSHNPSWLQHCATHPATSTTMHRDNTAQAPQPPSTTTYRSALTAITNTRSSGGYHPYDDDDHNKKHDNQEDHQSLDSMSLSTATTCTPLTATQQNQPSSHYHYTHPPNNSNNNDKDISDHDDDCRYLYGESMLASRPTLDDCETDTIAISTTTTARSVLSGVDNGATSRLDRPPHRVSFSTTTLHDMEEGGGRGAVSRPTTTTTTTTAGQGNRMAGWEQTEAQSHVQNPTAAWLQQQWRSRIVPTARNASRWTVQEVQHWSHTAVQRVRQYRRRPHDNEEFHSNDPNTHNDNDETDLLDHLSYLQRVHKEKVGQMTTVDYDDHYDFAIILQPQEVYAYWADLLDFRQEVLGEETVWDMNHANSAGATTVSPTSVHTQGTQESEATVGSSLIGGSDEPSVIDARPYPMTPSTMGIRQRRNKTNTHPSMSTETPRTAPPASKQSGVDALFSGGMLYDSGRPGRRPRTSIFQQAVGLRPSISGSKLKYDADDDDDDYHTPDPRTPLTPSTTANTARRRWGAAALSDHRTPTPNNRGAETPLSSSTRAATARRRWGASQTPVRSASRRSLMSRASSLRKQRRATQVMLPPSSIKESASDDEVAAGASRRKRNSLRIEDIPTQVIPRGIVARTHGMTEFLSALQRGILVRRHRPGNAPVFIKLYSMDGGDTVKYHLAEEEEIVMGFHYQRYRYNRKVDDTAFERDDSSPVVSAEDLPQLSLPSSIAAIDQRQRMSKEVDRKKVTQDEKTKVPNRVADMAFKASNSGVVRTIDIIDVHPASKRDPRSSVGEKGTASLRRSKTEYHAPFTFSLISKVERAFMTKAGKISNLTASEKWHSGEGKDSQFKSFDIETATEGEYWLAFRGFLLLHRDAASNRFAQQRNAGFGSISNAQEEDENILHRDEFKEPPTLSLLDKLVAKARGIDESEMKGHVLPGAVPPPSSDFLGFRSPGTEIWGRLRLALFQTQRIYGLDKRFVMIKVRCPSDRLTELAEVLHLKLKTRDGKLALFREDNIDTFRPLNDELDAPSFLGEASLFRSSDRQTIIDYIIRSRLYYSGAGLGQATDPLRGMIQKRVPLHMHAKLDTLLQAWFFFWRKDNWSSCQPAIPSDEESQYFDHSGAKNQQPDVVSLVSVSGKRVPNILYRFVVGSFSQPLDSIEQYFGEKVAFYFAWLQHCSFHLLFLSFAGLIVFICQLVSDQWDHPIRPYFATLVMLWSFVVLVTWRKRSNHLAYQWGTMNYKEQETPRPQFCGTLQKDEITGEWVPYYAPWKRWLKYSVSFPVVLLFTFGSLVLILLVHANRDNMLARYFEDLENSEGTTFEFTFSISSIGKQAPLNAVELSKEVLYDPLFWFIIAGLPALLGLFLPLLNFILMRVSVVLNDFENYRTETEYRTHLIIKVFSFRFVCYFATLYYYSFISVGTTQAIENGILRVGTGVFVYITVVHWWGVFVQVFFPLLIYRVRLWAQRKQLHQDLRQIEIEEADLVAAEAESSRTNDQDEFKKAEFEEKRVHLVNKRLLLDQAQDDTWLETMLPMHDSFPEYIQAVVLFAYATCFSVVLPIAPIICLANHLLSMRLDAYKLCRGRARTLAQKTGGIGVWEHVLHIVTVIAVLTNCWLMGFASAQFSDLAEKIGNLGLFCIVVAWEHVMLLIKYVMQVSISKFPKCIQDEMKREQHKETNRMNKAMRSKSGRRSQYGRESRRSISSEQESTRTTRGKPSDEALRPPSDFPSTRDPSQLRTEEEEPHYPAHGMAVSTVCEESCGGESSRLSNANVPTPCRLELDGEASRELNQRVDSPFGMFVPSKSFDSPSTDKNLRQPQSTGNISELLGAGLDDDDSLATNEN